MHHNMPLGLKPQITRRTDRVLIFAIRPIVAADGQHPVPSSREHASASASSTSRSFPDVGECDHTQFITAMLTGPASWRMSGSGSGMGAASSRQVRSGAVAVPDRTSMTCGDTHYQLTHIPACLVRDEARARPPR